MPEPAPATPEDIAAQVAHLGQQVTHLAQVVESQEQLVANLLIAYAEVATAIEVLTSTVMSTRTPEEQALFTQTFADFRKELLTHLSHPPEGAPPFEMDRLSEDLARTMEDLARQHDPDPPDSGGGTGSAP